jgi:hypothetical protein
MHPTNLAKLVPEFRFMNEDERDSLQLALTLTQAPGVIVRLTGGCAYMHPDDAANMDELFVYAFVGFNGPLLTGSIRMVSSQDPGIIIPSINEIPHKIKATSPGCLVLGVVPLTSRVKFDPRVGLMISEEEGRINTFHPERDFIVAIQRSVDELAPWEAEYKFCIRLTSLLREHTGRSSLLISYNGGNTTEKEILATASLGWPVLLIRGSGRITSQYAADKSFLSLHPNVAVCDLDPTSLRQALLDHAVVPPAVNIVPLTARKKAVS